MSLTDKEHNNEEQEAIKAENMLKAESDASFSMEDYRPALERVRDERGTVWRAVILNADMDVADHGAWTTDRRQAVTEMLELYDDLEQEKALKIYEDNYAN